MCQPSRERKGSVISLLLRLSSCSFELGEGARVEPAEIAALGGGGRILGGHRGEAREILALQDAVTDGVHFLAHGRVVLQLVRLHQDVAQRGSAPRPTGPTRRVLRLSRTM